MLNSTACHGKITPSNSTSKFLPWFSSLSCKSVMKKLLPNPNSTIIKPIFKLKNRCSNTNLLISRKRAQTKYSHYYLLPWICCRHVISIIRKEIPEGKFYWQSVCPPRKTTQRISHRRVSGTEESVLCYQLMSESWLNILQVSKIQIIFFYIYERAAIKSNKTLARLHKILNYAL